MSAHEPPRCQELCDPGAATSSCSARSSGCVAIDPNGSTPAGLCRVADPDPVGGSARPARVVVPDGYDGSPTPLLIALHGFGSGGTNFDRLFRLSRHARRSGFLLVVPDGTVNSTGRAFWNATPDCCDEERSGVDDSGYIAGLIAEMQTRYRVDERRVYVFGYSNGGFMAHRLACDHADIVTAIVNGAGSTFDDEADCHASRPVSVLGIHGTLDEITLGTSSPSALATIERWAARAGCDITMPSDDARRFDMDLAVAGPDTTARRYETGCAAGVTAEIWTIEGGMHAIQPSDDYTPRWMAWLMGQSR